ncbi:THUMP domain-containing class I SAM-dependent RNA methyltransferase [Pseudofulvibacter geojedonensis]|uniref:Class I SAM-dependent RNA methyltransferase n=1 Tax=Pseudofulvibacter geojedonensis TaxID=1123758 RepID=A0ABW3I1U0_9FLAO
MGDNFKMVAKTLFGFEDLLAKELRNLGAIDVKKGVRNVSFYGDIGFMYKANLCLRTAIKILKPIKRFKVRNEQDLYDQIYRIAWSKYMNSSDTLAVDATVFSTKFTHSKFIALKSKDAIVDKFRNTKGERPNVDLDYPDLRINVHIQQHDCTISLDSSGQSLHKRGYRSSTNIAPINEVLAAGLVMLSGWDGQCDLLDPMCGSGTLAIEAAMIACNIPANINRKEFGFEKWPNFDEELYNKIEESCLNKIREFHHQIVCYDKAPSAMRKARENVRNANLADYISVEHEDFFKTEKTNEGPLHILFNPPYGERLPVDVNMFYQQIGDTLKKGYANTNAWFITSNMEGLKAVGLRPSRKIKLLNGKLESRLVKYEMYEGSKKAKKQ